MHVSHLTVKDTYPQSQTVVIGHMYPIGEKLEEKLDLEFTEDEDSPEIKVVQRGRRPQPKATEGAETK